MAMWVFCCLNRRNKALSFSVGGNEHRVEHDLSKSESCRRSGFELRAKKIFRVENPDDFFAVVAAPSRGFASSAGAEAASASRIVVASKGPDLGQGRENICDGRVVEFENVLDQVEFGGLDRSFLVALLDHQQEIGLFQGLRIRSRSGAVCPLGDQRETRATIFSKHNESV